MHESEEKQRQADESVEKITKPGEVPKLTRVPAPDSESKSVWVPPSANETGPLTNPTSEEHEYRAQRRSQPYASPKEDLSRAGSPMQNQRTIPTSEVSQGTEPIQTKRSAHVASSQTTRRSQDWEDSFEKDRTLTTRRRRLLDKVIFIIILVSFLGVLFMLIYESIGEDPEVALRNFFEGKNPFRIIKNVTELGSDPSSQAVGDDSFVNLNLLPEIPAAPVFPLAIESRSYVVWDVEDEKLLYEAASEDSRDPASMTKVMTALLVLRSETSLDTTVTLTDEDFAGLYEINASVAGFKPGETVTIRDLLYGAMLPSGSEAAIALARFIAGSEAEFVVLMNQAAQELGMVKTTFHNSTGLMIDGQSNVTTARDLLALYREAIQYQDFIEIAGTHMRSIAPNPEHPEGLDLISTFTWKFNSDPEHRSNILAGKSGHNGLEQCLGTLATVGGKNYIVITLAAPTPDGHSATAVHDHVVIHNHILSS